MTSIRLDARLSELKGETFEEIDWFEWEWEWARKNTSYPVTPAIFEFLSDMLI